MRMEQFSRIKGRRQDGAIFGGYLFSFDHCGQCSVYEINSIKEQNNSEIMVICEFKLDKSDVLGPHSNSVSFGNEYYDSDDEFPLLYTNIYNTYAGCSDRLEGVTLVYRIMRKGNIFSSTLVQIIEIGFTCDEKLWKSSEKTVDVRPYGNFAIDRDSGMYYAFTMRDEDNTTRYFSFNLPKLSDGDITETYGVRKVTLYPEDIIEYFDCDYHHYIQGACCHKGKIYSLEGFANSEDNKPAIRIIDTKQKKQVYYKTFGEYGILTEPEMIDFFDDICYNTDHNGNIHILDFGDN